jgi:tetratricopeptide (TPR) repeat protein
MPNPIPHDPNLLALVEACNTHMRNSDVSELRRAFEPPLPGDANGRPSPDQLEVVYQTACRLCDEGNFRFATALALHLATYCPKEPRFNLIAGTCMQQLKAHANASRFYCFALINGGDNPAVLFRLGECLLALGDKANAEKALDAAFEVAREVEGADPLQSAVRDLLGSLAKGATP